MEREESVENKITGGLEVDKEAKRPCGWSEWTEGLVGGPVSEVGD